MKRLFSLFLFTLCSLQASQPCLYPDLAPLYSQTSPKQSSTQAPPPFFTPENDSAFRRDYDHLATNMLRSAIIHGDKKSFNTALHNYPNINHQDPKTGNTPLHDIIERHTDTVKSVSNRRAFLTGSSVLMGFLTTGIVAGLLQLLEDEDTDDKKHGFLKAFAAITSGLAVGFGSYKGLYSCYVKPKEEELALYTQFGKELLTHQAHDPFNRTDLGLPNNQGETVLYILRGIANAEKERITTMHYTGHSFNRSSVHYRYFSIRGKHYCFESHNYDKYITPFRLSLERLINRSQHPF